MCYPDIEPEELYDDDCDDFDDRYWEEYSDYTDYAFKNYDQKRAESLSYNSWYDRMMMPPNDNNKPHFN